MSLGTEPRLLRIMGRPELGMSFKDVWSAPSILLFQAEALCRYYERIDALNDLKTARQQ